MTAYQLRRLDRAYEIHLSAWANREVQAEKKVGKDKTELVHKDFNKFFDYEQKEKDILDSNENESEKYKQVMSIAKKLKKRREEERI